MILAIETSCDDTCAAVVTEDGRIASNVIASQGLLHARYGGVVPEIASRHHLELVDAVTADALERAGARLDDVDTVAVTRGPGLIGALLVGRLVRQGDRGHAGGCRSCRWTTSTGTWWRARWATTRSSRPTSAWWRAAATPSSRAWTTRALRGARPDARRRGRRGVRQGRPPARPRLSGRPGGRPAGARGRSRGVRLPAQRPRRARLQLQRAEDRAPVRDPRPGRGGPERAPTWPRPTSGRSSTRS